MLYSIAGLLGGIVALGCLVGYLPPYSWIADAQLSLMRTNIVAISLLGTFLITSAPFVLLARILERRIDPDGALDRKALRWDALLDTWPGKMMMIGATIAVVGGYLGYRDATRGPLTPVEVRALEGGDEPASTFAELRGGHVVHEGSIELRDGSSTSVYVPIVSRADRSTASVFARYRQGIARDAPLTGPLDRDDLPGEIRSAYEAAHAIDSPHWVLDVGADPSERADFAVWLVAFGALFVVVGLGWIVARHRGAVSSGRAA